jgi:hypothetical protein
MKAVPLVVLCALIIAVPSAWANWVKDGTPLCTATGNQWLPMVTSDGFGGAIVTWYDGRSGSYDIYAQRVNASGAVQWTTDGLALCAATGDQVYPQIIPDGAGGAIVTWQDTSGANWDIHAQRVDASGAVRWVADGVALCTATGDRRAPEIISDGAGGAIVTWYDGRSGSYDIYAQRVDALGAVQWTTDGVALCTAPGDQSHPTLTSDSAGGAIVTWQDNRSSSYTDIYAQRVNASGSVQWTPNGVGLCTAAGNQLDLTLVSDGASGAIVTWNDNRNGDLFDPLTDIYAQRVSSLGAVLWATNGVAVCTVTGNQCYPMIISDDMGGAIVTWYDYRGANIDIYAQRVDAAGAAQWTANGVALCTAAAPQMQPQITSDGAGGAIVAWYDYRGGDHPDIYSVRVDANGFPVLTAADAPGVPIELHQNYPNPFNPTTTVTYSVPEKCAVKLEIYDVSGKCVACLVDGQQEKGSHSVEWSGKDEKGSSVASGIYVYRLAAGGRTISKKMVLLR